MPERPRAYKTEGIILRRRNLGEADSIFTVLSPRQGKFDAIAKGVRKPRSRMRGHLEPLTRSRLLLARGRSLDVFTQAETITPYRAIRDDLERSATALYCAELADRFTIEHADNPGLYELMLAVLEALDLGAPPGPTARYFELQILSLMGYELQLDCCAACRGRLEPVETLLSPSAGGLVCERCRVKAGAGRLLGVRAIKVLRYARNVDIAAFGEVRIDAVLANELEVAMAGVVSHFLEREPRSRHFVEAVAALPGRPNALAPEIVRSDQGP